MGERGMELDPSPLLLLANTAVSVLEANLNPTPSTRTQQTGKDKIREMHGQDVMLVVEKTLTTTDMLKHRISIPKGKMKTGETFLREEELAILDSKKGIEVSLVEPCLQVSRGWQLHKCNYKGENFSYMLMGSRDGVVHPFKRNNLTKDGLIQLWSFRVDGNLCFCLVKLH